MKKLTNILAITMMLLTIISSALAQSTITQTVTGTTQLDETLLTDLEEKYQILFGPTGAGVISQDTAVRSDYYIANGMFANCNGVTCDLVQTLEQELTAATLSTTAEEAVRTAAIADLNICLDNLVTIYSATPPLLVGSATYFNDVKLNYVCTLKNLGMLEKIFIDEPEAWFLVQKLQEIEENLQHNLAIEDDEAAFDFAVSQATVTGTAAGFDALSFTISETAPGSNVYTLTATDLYDANFVNPTKFRFAVITDFAETDYSISNVVVTGDASITGTVTQSITNDVQIGTFEILAPPQIGTIDFTIDLSATNAAEEFLIAYAFNSLDNLNIIGGTGPNIGHISTGGAFVNIVVPNNVLGPGFTGDSDNPGINFVNFPTPDSIIYDLNTDGVSTSTLVNFVVVPSGQIVIETTPAGTEPITTTTSSFTNFDIVIGGFQGPVTGVNFNIAVPGATAGDVGTIGAFFSTNDFGGNNNFNVVTENDIDGSAGSTGFAADIYIPSASTSAPGLGTVNIDSFNNPGAPLDGFTGFITVFYDSAQPAPIFGGTGVNFGGNHITGIDGVTNVAFDSVMFTVPPGTITPQITITASLGATILFPYTYVVIPEGATTNDFIHDTTLNQRVAFNLLDGAGGPTSFNIAGPSSFFQNLPDIGTNYFMPNDPTFGPPNRFGYTPQVGPVSLYGQIITLYAGPAPGLIPPNLQSTITLLSTTALGGGASIQLDNIEWYVIDGTLTDDVVVNAISNTGQTVVEGKVVKNTAPHQSFSVATSDGGGGFTPTGAFSFGNTNVETSTSGTAALLIAAIVVVGLFFYILRKRD